jgi:ATP-dependent Zn protease
MKENKLRDTAYHEAGHAVAAWWFGQLKKRDHVTIIPDP